VRGSFEAPGGVAFERTYMHHPGAVGIVPLDGSDVLMVRQYRPALDEVMLEIPAGTIDDGESPLDCAVRELEEEVGARAASVSHLLTYAVAVGVSDERLHLYVARGLTLGTPAADGVEEQHMTIERLALSDVAGAIADGRIVDAKTIIALLMVGS